ncbi:MAG: Rne/Rng family ribonuclease [Buchnera aphidicola (Schlechtendalia peitan)]
MKRILINATKKHKLQIAIVNKTKLCNFEVENLNYTRTKSNIYKGKITRIEPSLEAVFVDYGSFKNGFLPLKSISHEYFCKNIGQTNYNILNVLRKGQEFIVQINKEENGNKGALLTTFISLVGSYVVFFPNNSKILGISKKIEGRDRISLKKKLYLLNIPYGMGVIIRTASIGKSIDVLQLDLEYQLKRWNKIKEMSLSHLSPHLICQEDNIIFRTFRDYLSKNIDEILIDNAILLNSIYRYILLLGKNDYKNKVKLYTGLSSLFNYYQIDSQINSIFQRNITLPSGGSIVIDITEALTAIDINSFRSTNGINSEETAFNTNLEAANEISRQLRLRDVGGLIVIDFIDMSILKHRKFLIDYFRNIIQKDRAHIKIGTISKFGLLEMSRQGLNSPIKQFHNNICSRCSKI